MVINHEKLRQRLRDFADQAAGQARVLREQGDEGEASFQSGRQAAFVTALAHITDLENEAARERDETAMALSTLERIADSGFGDFAFETGALDQASGEVISDAGEGL